MLGRDFPELGSVAQKNLGRAIGCISAGQDPNSPSFAYKGDKVCPNEDGLVILKEGTRWAFAVADGHLGHESSHALLEGLGALNKIPARLGPLSLILSAAEWLETTAGGTTLLVASYEESSRSIFGISFGDSSLVTLSRSGAKVRNHPNEVYLRGGGPVDVERGVPFQFQLEPEELLLLYTDGVNECCYRDPHRSVQLQHLEALYESHASDPAALVEALMQLALAGVDGHAGGQDNIAMIGFSA